ncbi:calcium-binding protein 7 isoform X1 [Ovis aries]|uniref:calcium-binding protein 7 isoform X1 n=1 Tax=Ovis aries TaxID=9940 RepID=UPI0005FABDC0|nr:calcium-binding protein 7 isoform X1 [Ovis aries]
MPFHPVTAALMYRGIYTVPNLLSEQRPVDIPEDELEEIREAFKVFDRDGNGFISKQELGTAMRSLGYMPNEVELEVIIQRLDMDGDGQVDFEEFVTLLGPKLSTSGIPEKFHGTDFDTVFWKCDMQKLTVDELKRLLYDTFCEHLSMKDIENIIMTEEESHLGTAEECPVDVESEWPPRDPTGGAGEELHAGGLVCPRPRVSTRPVRECRQPLSPSLGCPFCLSAAPRWRRPQPAPTSRSARRACGRASSAPSPSPSSSASCSSQPTRCCAVA